jgi:hypothetical protein
MPAAVSGDRFRIDGLAPGPYLVTAQTLEEGDARLVEVAAGGAAEIVLESRGSGTLEGTLVNRGTGAPIAGALCHTVLRAGGFQGVTSWSPDISPHSDAQGRFVLQRAPAGDVHVTCFGSGSALAGAIATVPQGGRATVRLEVVNRDGTGGSIGVDFADFSFEPRVARLVAGGPAAQAGVAVGDLIVALAGEDVRGLDALSVRGLIRNLPVGGRVALGVQRGSAARRTVQVAVVLEE